MSVNPNLMIGITVQYPVYWTHAHAHMLPAIVLNSSVGRVLHLVSRAMASGLQIFKANFSLSRTLIL